MSKDREEIHVSDALRKAMDGRKEPLSSVINLIVERYLGMISRAESTPMMSYHADLTATYCAKRATRFRRRRSRCSRSPAKTGCASTRSSRRGRARPR